MPPRGLLQPARAHNGAWLALPPALLTFRLAHGRRSRRSASRCRLRRQAIQGIEDFRIFRADDGQEFELFPDRVLGAGAQGTVYAGTAKANGQAVAVKVVPTWRLVLDDSGQEKLEAIEAEYQTLRALGQHPNIAGMIASVDLYNEGAASAFPHYKFMVMEKVAGRELAEHIAVEGPLPESLARHVFVQVLDGLTHVHSRGIIHRDLKPENVLVSGDPVSLDSCVKLIDFGVAKCIGSGPLQTVVGTPCFMAPEVAKVKIGYAPGFGQPAGTRHTFSWVGPPEGCEANGVSQAVCLGQKQIFCPKIDVWSAGTVLYTCLTGKIPFKSELEIIESDYLRGPLAHVSAEARDLVAGMLEKDPKKRLSVEECGQHGWMACSIDDGCTIDPENMPQDDELFF